MHHRSESDAPRLPQRQVTAHLLQLAADEHDFRLECFKGALTQILQKRTLNFRLMGIDPLFQQLQLAQAEGHGQRSAGFVEFFLYGNELVDRNLTAPGGIQAAQGEDQFLLRQLFFHGVGFFSCLMDDQRDVRQRQRGNRRGRQRRILLSQVAKLRRKRGHHGIHRCAVGNAAIRRHRLAHTGNQTALAAALEQQFRGKHRAALLPDVQIGSLAVRAGNHTCQVLRQMIGSVQRIGRNRHHAGKRLLHLFGRFGMQRGCSDDQVRLRAGKIDQRRHVVQVIQHKHQRRLVPDLLRQVVRLRRFLRGCIRIRRKRLRNAVGRDGLAGCLCQLCPQGRHEPRGIGNRSAVGHNHVKAAIHFPQRADRPDIFHLQPKLRRERIHHHGSAAETRIRQKAGGFLYGIDHRAAILRVIRFSVQLHASVLLSIFTHYTMPRKAKKEQIVKIACMVWYDIIKDVLGGCLCSAK